jgi:hypothetical protein
MQNRNEVEEDQKHEEEMNALYFETIKEECGIELGRMK